MTLSARIAAQLTATLAGSPDLSAATDVLDYRVRQDFTSGAGADQADMMWTDRRTLSASATEDLDLAGVLVNALGQTQTFARIKAIMVKAAAGNTNNVNVIRPAANGVPLFLAAGDGIAVKPDGLFLWVAPDASGVAVTPATGDLLTITNSGAGTGVTYDIVIIGAAT